ncbi:hypothetical protein AOQ84DRAFT_220425 [Glonium stellatum]|uniref:Uncharacterized protein n=1 Tax=Glonium stellatum TaxID=574774 RepID=A0A8E2F398_9PEZI|nr:hypothetical protein AOQ84DRAFT_220425 [Glonium stellatum]
MLLPSSFVRSMMAGTHRLRATCPPGTKIASVRRLHRTPRPLFAQKDAQDKDSLKPRSTQYSQSGGGDDAAAAMEKAAFDPSETSPEQESKEADAESGKASQKSSDPNPLDVSPGNPDVSQPRGQQEGGAQSSPGDSSSGRARTSGGGSAPKAGGNKSG